MPEGLCVVDTVGRRFGGRMQRGRTSLHQGRNTRWAAGSLKAVVVMLAAV